MAVTTTPVPQLEESPMTIRGNEHFDVSQTDDSHVPMFWKNPTEVANLKNPPEVTKAPHVMAQSNVGETKEPKEVSGKRPQWDAQRLDKVLSPVQPSTFTEPRGAARMNNEIALSKKKLQSEMRKLGMEAMASTLGDTSVIPHPSQRLPPIMMNLVTTKPSQISAAQSLSVSAAANQVRHDVLPGLVVASRVSSVHPVKSDEMVVLRSRADGEHKVMALWDIGQICRGVKGVEEIKEGGGDP
jgi:hypothetical protein